MHRQLEHKRRNAWVACCMEGRSGPESARNGAKPSMREGSGACKVERTCGKRHDHLRWKETEVPLRNTETTLWAGLSHSAPRPGAATHDARWIPARDQRSGSDRGGPRNPSPGASPHAPSQRQQQRSVATGSRSACGSQFQLCQAQSCVQLGFLQTCGASERAELKHDPGPPPLHPPPRFPFPRRPSRKRFGRSGQTA